MKQLELTEKLTGIMFRIVTGFGKSENKNKASLNRCEHIDF